MFWNNGYLQIKIEDVTMLWIVCGRELSVRFQRSAKRMSSWIRRLLITVCSYNYIEHRNKRASERTSRQASKQTDKYDQLRLCSTPLSDKQSSIPHSAKAGAIDWWLPGISREGHQLISRRPSVVLRYLSLSHSVSYAAIWMCLKIG